MKYQNRVVAFIDILGFSGIIKATYKEWRDEENAELIKKITSAFKLIKEQFTQKNIIINKTVTQFSDSLLISFPLKEKGAIVEILQDIQRVVVSLSRMGFFTRGSVTLGKAIHTDTMVFGPAIVSAYELEKSAYYPRVIIDKKVINASLIHFHPMNGLDAELALINNTISPDHDGYYFIDYFDVGRPPVFFTAADYCLHLLDLKKSIQKGLRNKDSNVRIKYGWMKEKVNAAITDFITDEFLNELKQQGNKNLYHLFVSKLKTL